MSASHGPLAACPAHCLAPGAVCATACLPCPLPCTRCRVRHSLPVSSEALRAAEEVVRQIEAHGRLDFDVPLEAANPLYSADYVWTKGSGRMLGVLIACEQEGCSVTEDIVLRQDASSTGVTGVVPPGGERLHALEAFSSGGGEVPESGGPQLHILKAFSGQMTESWLVPG